MNQTRRDFLADVGKGMLVASLGTGMVHDLGLGSLNADEAPDRSGPPRSRHQKRKRDEEAVDHEHDGQVAGRNTANEHDRDGQRVTERPAVGGSSAPPTLPADAALRLAVLRDHQTPSCVSTSWR